MQYLECSFSTTLSDPMTGLPSHALTSLRLRLGTLLHGMLYCATRSRANQMPSARLPHFLGTVLLLRARPLSVCDVTTVTQSRIVVTYFSAPSHSLLFTSHQYHLFPHHRCLGIYHLKRSALFRLVPRHCGVRITTAERQRASLAGENQESHP